MDALTLMPSTSYGDGRTCKNGDACVCSVAHGKPTVLCRYNPGVTCYACQSQAKRRWRAVKELGKELGLTGVAA